ncbi:DUF4783 domain-containing protein [Candidatus Uabimicrobium sp. HlEnr_7]|uniref:DUF4783 domain-containing protein n=1 Tax=Candidatus Uabimicrobium helgolandensis TaxID=3095367 RepID=UPI003556996D
MLKRLFIFLFFAAFLPNLLLAKGNNAKKLPTMPVFLTVKKIWIEGKAGNLQPLLSHKVSLNLGKQKGRFSKGQATAILKTYFRKMQVTEFKYYQKKMQLAKASALCCYKLKRSGKKRQKIIYIYLVLDTKNRKWLISGISIIG